MPRDGAGVYHHPFPDVVEGTTVESAVFNGNTADVEQDLNTPRPISAGGTGASDARTARDNLDAEVAKQQVTNYDSHVWESGSFTSETGATGAPKVGYFYGTYTEQSNPAFATIQAVEIGGASYWVRHKTSGTWGTWIDQSAAAAIATYDARYVNVTGDAMTGTLRTAVTAGAPSLAFDGTVGANNNDLYSNKGSLPRWVIRAGNAAAESGGNAGSDFNIISFNDAGAALAIPLTITRSTGAAAFSGNVTAGGSSYYFGSSGTKYLTYDGTNFNLAGGTLIAPGASLGTTVFAPTNASLKISHHGTTGYGVTFQPQVDGGTSHWFQNASAVGCGSITHSAGATAYNTSSDGRLKEDLKSFSAGNIIDDTEVYDFKWKSTEERSYGVIAQQAVEVYPTAVTYLEEQDWYGIDYSKYVPVILQELKALRARVAELEGKTEIGVKPP